MIEIRYLNNKTQIQHYSDKGMMLRQDQTGDLYEDPIDLIPCKYTYTETDIPIKTKEDEERERLEREKEEEEKNKQENKE